MKFGNRATYIIHKITSIVSIVSGVSLLIMVFFVVADVVGRYFFNKPIMGGYEIQELLMVLIVFLAFGFVTRDKGHVYVELLVQRFKGRTLSIVNSLTCLMSLGFVVLLAWQMVKSGLEEMTSTSGDFTPMLHIPVGPFMIIAAAGLAFMALEFLIELVTDISRIGVTTTLAESLKPDSVPSEKNPE